MEETTSSSETRCKNPQCRREVAQVGGGHRKREYCDDACRQAARRARQEIARRQQCIEQVSSWGTFQPATIEYLANWLYTGNEEGARRLAALIASEQGQASARSSDANEKLMQAGQRISKLEKQVEIQQQRLRQYYARFYPSTLAVAAERLLALGALLGYKPLLKYDELTVEIAAGASAWQEFARTANYDEMAQAIVQAQRFQQQLAECHRSRAGEQEAAIHRLIVQEYAARLYLSFCEEPIPLHRNGTTYSIVTGNLPNHKVVAQLGDKQYETLEISEQEAAYFQEYCYRQLYQTYQAKLDV